MAVWTSWQDFADADAELAAFGRRRLGSEVAYLATIRDNGLPRVHPIQPIISDYRLLVFMFPTSPKGHDLRKDGRYALHTAVSDTSGSNGEFLVRGRGRLVSDPVVRTEAAEAGYQPREEYILFELGIEEVLVTEYHAGTPRYRRWSGDKS